MTNKLIEAMAMALEHNSQLRGWVSYESDAAAALKAISDAGFAVVPRDPTEAMLEAARDVPFIAMGNGEYIEPDRSDIYRAMINATTTEES